MKLWLIRQTTSSGWDTYDSAIVAAPTIEDAKKMAPDWLYADGQGFMKDWKERFAVWAHSPDEVEASYIGEAAEHITQGPVLGSFNAG